MIRITKQEISLKMIYLHFLYLSKANKLEKNIARNGKLPDPALKSDTKKGYKTYCLLTLRKWLEGLFPVKKFSLLKEKYNDTYSVTPNGIKHEYGTVSLLDNLLWLAVMRQWNPGIINFTSFHERNHGFDFACSDISRLRAPLYTLRYSIDFQAKEQTFTPIAFRRYEEYIEEVATGIRVADEKTAAGAVTVRLLNRLKDNNFLKRDVTVARRAEPADALTSLAVKYRIPKTVLEQFVENFNNTVSGSRGLSIGQIFEFTKRVHQNLHERIVNLEFHDFEDMAA